MEAMSKPRPACRIDAPVARPPRPSSTGPRWWAGASPIAWAGLAALALLLSAPEGADAAEVLSQHSWTAAAARDALPQGARVVGGGSSGGAWLEVRNGEDRPLQVRLLDIPRPAIRRARYALVGTVRYEGVEGTGYVEMWSRFSGGGSYYTRTLSESGPMGVLRGSGPARPLLLPFTNRQDAPPPEQLEVNLVLSGRGTVVLSPLELVQFEDDEAMLAGPVAGAGGELSLGLLGIGLGVLLGALGAALGMLAGLGRSLRVALGLDITMGVLGLSGLIYGLVALLTERGFAVWYPFLVAGGVGLVLSGALFPVLRWRRRQLEAQRMRTADLGGAEGGA